MRTNTTLVINPKGGSGKTTVATNLASYFAANGIPAAMMDYDPQGSTLNWLRIRPATARKIHGANAAPQKTGLRSIGMHVPADTRQLIIDAPAGATGLALQEMLSRSHCILIPVAPSSIDIHATANFIRDLLLTGKIRANNIRLAVVANRVRKSNPVYQPLERFLTALNLPLLARLRTPTCSSAPPKAGSASSRWTSRSPPPSASSSSRSSSGSTACRRSSRRASPPSPAPARRAPACA